jgi:putative oxidoreductase
MEKLARPRELIMRPYTPAVAAIGRLLIAVIFIMSGLGKIADPTGTQGYIASAGLPVPLLAYLTAIVVEVGGGILLVVGYQTRIVALVMAAFTLAAALGFHNNFADQNQMIHFLKNIAMMGGLLQVVAFGAGAFSLDGRAARDGGRTATATA